VFRAKAPHSKQVRGESPSLQIDFEKNIIENTLIKQNNKIKWSEAFRPIELIKIIPIDESRHFLDNKTYYRRLICAVFHL